MTQLLEPDTYRRDAWPPLPGVSRRGHDTVHFGLLLLLALGLVVASKFDSAPVGAIRAHVQDAAAPVLRRVQATARPVVEAGRLLADWRTLADERNRLRDENDRLRGWEARARVLEHQSVALNEMMRMVAEPRL